MWNNAYEGFESPGVWHAISNPNLLLHVNVLLGAWVHAKWSLLSLPGERYRGLCCSVPRHFGHGCYFYFEDVSYSPVAQVSKEA